jgi:hypothetical protein
MDPLVQLVKELLESADPQISVVECRTTCGHSAAKTDTTSTDKSLDQADPDHLSPTDRK